MLKVREATMGKGGVCGSTILNRIFQKHIEDRFKGMRGWNNEGLEDGMEKFEKTTKRNFGGSLTVPNGKSCLLYFPSYRSQY